MQFQKTKAKTTLSLASIILCAALVFPGLCLAHFPWLNAEDYSPDQGAALSLTIGYGHSYPFAGFLSKDKVEDLVLKGPSGKAPTLYFTSDFEIKSSENITTPGAYVVGASKKPGFYTKTTEGGKQVSKKGLKNVLKCSFSHNFMKAVVNVGDVKGRVDTLLGHAMEIVLLKNPAELRAGDSLPVKILYKGKPWAGQLTATYAGFSTEKDTWAQTLKTDKNGMTKISLKHGGYWLVRVSQEERYADSGECDTETFNATLTFELK